MDDETRLRFARLHLLDAAHLLLDVRLKTPDLEGAVVALEALSIKLLAAVQALRGRP